MHPASLAGIALLPALLATCHAQRPLQPGLDEILVQREADLSSYRSTVPDFFVEASIPDHEITPGVIGLWTWSIDYAPVVLDRKIFWMPKTVQSHAVADDRRAAWSFTATYTNYHKLEVNSHIITDLGNAPSPPPQ